MEGYTILPEVLSRAETERTRYAIDETLTAEAEIARRYGLQNEDLQHLSGCGRHWACLATPVKASLAEEQAELVGDLEVVQIGKHEV